MTTGVGEGVTVQMQPLYVNLNNCEFNTESYRGESSISVSTFGFLKKKFTGKLLD